MGALLVLVVALMGTACGGSDGASVSPTAIDFSDSVTITGDALPPVVDPIEDPAIGRVAPSVDGLGFDSSPVSIAHDGRPQVLLFVAHWCPHCRDEVAELSPWFSENPPPDSLKVVTIATGSNAQRPNFPPSEWLKGADWPLPVLVDTQGNDVGTAYGLTAFPYWVVLEGDGSLLARTAGSLPLANVEALFNRLSDLESSS